MEDDCEVKDFVIIDKKNKYIIGKYAIRESSLENLISLIDSYDNNNKIKLLKNIGEYNYGCFDKITNHVLRKSKNWNFINSILNLFNLDSYVEILIKAIKYGQIGIIYKYLHKVDGHDNIKLILTKSLDNLEIFKYVTNYCYGKDFRSGGHLLEEAIRRKKTNIVKYILETSDLQQAYFMNGAEYLYFAYETCNYDIIILINSNFDLKEEFIKAYKNPKSDIIINIFESIDNKNEIINHINQYCYAKINMDFLYYLIDNQYDIKPKLIYNTHDFKLLFHYLSLYRNIKLNIRLSAAVGYKKCNVVIKFFRAWRLIPEKYTRFMDIKDTFLKFENDSILEYFDSRIEYLSEISKAADNKIKSVPYGGTNIEYIKRVVPIAANYIILERYYECFDDFPENINDIIEIIKYYGINFKGTSGELKLKIKEILDGYSG